MKKDIKYAFIGAIIGIIFGDIPFFLLSLYFDNKIPVINLDFSPLIPYIFILFPLILAIISLILAKKSKKISLGFAIQNPPGVIDNILEVTYLGVIWEVQVGRKNQFANELIYYVDRALCPKCKAELMRESKLWRCPDISCGFKKNVYLSLGEEKEKQ